MIEELWDSQFFSQVSTALSLTVCKYYHTMICLFLVFLSVFLRDGTRLISATDFSIWLNSEISSSIELWCSTLKDYSLFWILKLDNVLMNLSLDSGFQRNLVKWWTDVTETVTVNLYCALLSNGRYRSCYNKNDHIVSWAIHREVLLSLYIASIAD